MLSPKGWPGESSSTLVECGASAHTLDTATPATARAIAICGEGLYVTQLAPRDASRALLFFASSLAAISADEACSGKLAGTAATERPEMSTKALYDFVEAKPTSSGK